jgi:predicted SAM-dependent methyltransferase
MKCINLGCGTRFHPDWINIDIAPTATGIIAHDLSTGIPLADASCDVVYHSHVLEHLRPPHAIQFMRECCRVLKPGCVLRVAVPDLESIIRVYLEKLQAALNNDAKSAHDYRWILLELLDQSVREQTGGQMLDYLSQSPMPNEEFVFARIGEEGRSIIRILKEQAATVQMVGGATSNTKSSALQHLRSTIRLRLLERWLGPNWSEALEIGRFRLGGEIHQWMYDRYSLAELMRTCGFLDPIQRTATESHIPDWPSFCLDTLADGTVVKPDSLFMEAKRPS